MWEFENIQKFFNTLPFKGWSLIPFSLSVSWTKWLILANRIKWKRWCATLETRSWKVPIASCLPFLLLFWITHSGRSQLPHSGKNKAILWRGPDGKELRPSANSQRQTEASSQQPYEWAFLEADPPAPVNLKMTEPLPTA